MVKYLLTLVRPDGMERSEFDARLLDAQPPPEEESGITGYAVSLRTRPERDTHTDAVVEVYVGDATGRDAATVLSLLPEVEALAGRCSAFRVTERVKLDWRPERTWPDGEVTPGLKALYFALHLEGATRAEFDRYWDEQHAPLALRHHVGMWRYVQNAVLDHAGDGVPDPALDGVAALWFPTEADYEERFFDSPAGRDAIVADVAKFGRADGPRMILTRETILRSPS